MVYWISTWILEKKRQSIENWNAGICGYMWVGESEGEGLCVKAKHKPEHGVLRYDEIFNGIEIWKLKVEISKLKLQLNLSFKFDSTGRKDGHIFMVRTSMCTRSTQSSMRVKSCIVVKLNFQVWDYCMYYNRKWWLDTIPKLGDVR